MYTNILIIFTYYTFNMTNPSNKSTSKKVLMFTHGIISILQKEGTNSFIKFQSIYHKR